MSSAFFNTGFINCTRDNCHGEKVSFCLTCQIASPYTIDHEDFAKEFQTFPRCSKCITNFHSDHETIPKSVVSLDILSNYFTQNIL